MVRWPTVVLVLCLLTATVGVSPGAAAGAGEPVGLALAQEFDRAEFRITVFANGSARWTFRYERTLTNDTDRRRFEAFAEDFNSNETRLFTDFRNQSRTLVRQGTEATGREMSARAFDRRAFVATGLNDAGVVEMAFTWTGFARTSADRVVVGDVFEGGLYLGPDQALVVEAADRLAFETVDPGGTPSGGSLAVSDTVTWMGERTFTDNRPRVVLVPNDSDGSVSPTGTGADDGTETSPGTADGSSSGLWALLFVIAAIAVALGMFLYRRRGGPLAGDSPDQDGPAEATTIDQAVLMDDEDRVESLLREHGGRMRQSALVDATGWSKSKVSMVLSEMAEADRIRKLQVGRENIVSLPGHEPEAAGSPHDADDEGPES
jgi:hypothetical protein